MQGLAELLARDSWSEEEKQWMLHYMQETHGEELKELLAEDFLKSNSASNDSFLSQESAAMVLNKVHQKIENEEGIEVKRRGVVLQMLRPVAVAVGILGLLFAGYWFFVHKSSGADGKSAELMAKANDIEAPKDSKARIILADGSTLSVDSFQNGTLAIQDNIRVTMNEEGKIIYIAEKNSAEQELQYNTLLNPRGSEVAQLTLTDGTKVWLNSESSLRYPVVFKGNDRKVEVTGEAYFEVAHDKARPFYVSKGSVHVQVLGTHFNVNSYKDENDVKVTLLEGSVAVKNESSSLQIAPLEQAIVANNGTIAMNKSVDVQQVMAWKNGYFSFKSTSIDVLMKQVARWYDVEVEFESGIIPKQRFGGEIPRNTNLSQTLEMLKTSGVNFSLENRRVLIW